MRRKENPASLEKFLGSREGIESITAKRLESDLSKLAEEIRGFAGNENLVNGASAT